MAATATPPAAKPDQSSIRDNYLAAYQWMLRARLLDDKLASLYRAGKMHGGVFLGRGQEAVSAALGCSLRHGDVFAPLIRDLAGRLAFGQPLLDHVRSYLGSVSGPMRGRDGNVHHGRPREGVYPMISHLGAMIAVVNGALLAKRLKGETGAVGAACIGDGATSTGAFHEALNQAGIEKLPLVLVVANNQYAYSTPNSRQFACAELVTRAAGYGVTGHKVDGTDLAACLAVLGCAVAQARAGEGPQLVVAELLRLCGHGEHDDAGYMDHGLKKLPFGRDCVKVAEAAIIAAGWAAAAGIETWRTAASREIEDAVAKAQREAAPDPYKEDWRAIASKHLVEEHFA
jgi:pyruvate dehydrogenase E1 component alpha subunit/2-oxoisovalerate dehydrogenase E1 component alpha subunit